MNQVSNIKSSTSYCKRLGLFFKAFLMNPAKMGAALPSSKFLAQKILENIPEKDGLIVELGAGTGAITRVLASSNLPKENIIAIELSAELCKVLKKDIPEMTVLNADAMDLKNILKPYDKPVIAIVSGLPLRSLPKTMVKELSKLAQDILGDEGVYIQFTYDLRPNGSKVLPDMKCISSHFVLRNLPPAKVDVYSG